MPKSINQYLHEVIKHYEVKPEAKVYRKKRDLLEKAIRSKFKEQIDKIIVSGSFQKNTAISCKYDMDLVVSFKADVDKSLKQIYNEVFGFFEKEYAKAANDNNFNGHPKKQKVSIGLTFTIKKGRKLSIDIIPAKKVHKDQTNQDLALYVNEEFRESPHEQEVRTNIHKQIDYVKNNHQAKSVIKLLKVWKYQRPKPLKSFLIELLVIAAFKDDTYQAHKKGLWGKVDMVMRFIEDNIIHASFKDVGNKGNNLSDTLTVEQKKSLKTRMQRIRKEINEAQEQDLSTVIKKYFPKT